MGAGGDLRATSTPTTNFVRLADALLRARHDEHGLEDVEERASA